MRNQYDETKKMLNVLRTLSMKKNLIKEQPEMGGSSENKDVAVVNDVDIKLISQDKSDLELSNEQKEKISQIIDNFRQQVSRIVKFEPGFVIKPSQIRLDGSLEDDEIIFTMVAGENEGIFINTNMTELTDETLEIITKLKNFQEMFLSSMEELINDLNSNI
jgi:hypothetical protein